MERYSTVYPQFIETFLGSIYVYGADDADSAYELYKKSKQSLAEGGFNLRKFVTNSVSLNQNIQQNEPQGSPECQQHTLKRPYRATRWRAKGVGHKMELHSR